MRRSLPFIVLGVIALSFVRMAPASAAAPVLRVTKLSDETPDGCTRSDCSLREAIIKSNRTRDVEQIVLGPGTHELTLATDSEDASATGDLDIRRTVTIRGVAGQTEIHQQTTDRVLHVLGSARLALRDVKVFGGYVNTLSGGGLRIEDRAGATLSRVTVTSNVAHSSNGGGIYNLGRLSVIDSTIEANGTDLAGGGIYADGDVVTITRSRIVSNDSSGNGGGIYFDAPGTLSVTDSTVAFNEAAASAGGIYVDAGVTGDPGPRFTLRRSAVHNNGSDARAGGLFLVHGSAQTDARFLIQDSTISGNGTVGEGGGFYCGCYPPALRIVHATITDNTADANGTLPGNAGGGFVTQGSSVLEVTASIIAGNHDVGGTQPDCRSPVTSLGANVFGSIDCMYEAQPSDQVVADGSFLGPLVDNGGPTSTHALSSDDPAVDVNDDTGCGGTDQRGAPRRSDGCDAGAYELTFCDDRVVNVVGTPRRDTLTGTNGNDGILALGGSDTIHGGAGMDWICAGSGNDRVYGDAGADLLKGESGDDLLDGGLDSDTCIGGSGRDRIVACEAVV